MRRERLSFTAHSDKRKIDFQPANIFTTYGQCPSPKVIQVFDKSFSLSYDHICDFARMARPLIVLVSMVISMGMAYSAIKEL